jgi:hypothetical protein
LAGGGLSFGFRTLALIGGQGENRRHHCDCGERAENDEEQKSHADPEVFQTTPEPRSDTFDCRLGAMRYRVTPVPELTYATHGFLPV